MTYKPSSNKAVDSAQKGGKHRTVVLVVGALILSAFVYGSGMEAEIHKARTVNEQRKLAEQEYRDAQRNERQRIAAVEQLEARRQLALALDSLDKRNFGMSQGDVQTASELLDEAQALQTSNPDLSETARALKATNLVATNDIGTERDALMTITSKMDASFDSFTRPFIKDSIANDAAHPIKAPTMNDIPNLPGTDKGSDLTTGQDFRK